MGTENIRILLIEDNPGDARLLREGLRDSGAPFGFDVSERLSDALAALAEKTFDVVLLDLSLPDAQGLEAFSKVVAQVPDVPILVLTGNDDEETAMRAVNEGAQDYLVKGRVAPEVLARSIRYAIERHRLVAELRRLDALKTRFIADAAHELRQPLATLAGYAHLLATRRDSMTDDQMDRSFVALERQSEHINTLISNLLDLSQLEQQHLSVDLQTVAVADAAARSLDVAPAPPGKSVEVRTPVDVSVRAEVSRLDQILINLLTNAYRYGGDQIILEAANVPGAAQIVVSDNGDGVPANLVDHLFEPFARGPNTTNVRGSGLGLAIVRKIANAFGGDIAYVPNEPQGSRFVLTLLRA